MKCVVVDGRRRRLWPTRYLPVSAAVLAAGLATPAPAQPVEPADDDAVTGALTAGIGFAPDYEGSNDYQIVPLIAGRVAWRGFSVETNGLGVQADLVPLPQISLGPVIRYASGRDDVDDALVDLLPDVDSGVEVGGHAGFSQRGLLAADDVGEIGIEVVGDVGDGHGGITVALSAGWSVPLTEDLRIAASASGTWASEEYMDSFFSIDAAGAAASGLRRFDADAGIKDVGIGTTLSYAITESFSAVGIVSYTRLLGDAADSPVTDDRGSPDQVFGGLAISYRF